MIPVSVDICTEDRNRLRISDLVVNEISGIARKDDRSIFCNTGKVIKFFRFRRSKYVVKKTTKNIS